MTKNPLVNGVGASLYIFLLVSVMTWGSKMVPQEDKFFAPVVFISLFTLSAAVMGYIFCYQPATLYFDGKKKQGMQLFLKTVIVFATITIALVILFFSGVVR
ncbi:MAG: hypothetical protein WAV51_01900 [Microgenomates group bacterium]